jgi:hypothetical protein
MVQKLRAFWAAQQKKKSDLLVEYGWIAIVTLVALQLPIYVGILIYRWDELRGVGLAKTLGILWLSGRGTLLFRLPIALVLTPFVAKLFRRTPRNNPQA